jgi:hypothetical protein
MNRFMLPPEETRCFSLGNPSDLATSAFLHNLGHMQPFIDGAQFPLQASDGRTSTLRRKVIQ